MTEPAAGPGMRETALTIEGMTCAACAARVQKKLNGLQGGPPTVNYATGDRPGHRACRRCPWRELVGGGASGPGIPAHR